MKFMMNIKDPRYIVPLLYFLGFFAFFNPPVMLCNSGLDPSWVLVFNLGSIFSFNFGQDFIFTYGPLGFLGIPAVVTYQFFWIATIFQFLVLSFFIFFLYKVITEIQDNIYLQLLPLLFAPFYSHMGMSFRIILLTILIIYYVLISNSSGIIRRFLLFFVGILLAIGSLMKFDVCMNSVFLIIISLFLFFSFKRDIFIIILLPVSFVCCYTGLWLMTDQKVTNLIPFFYYSIKISTGYNDAMGIDAIIPVLITSVFLFMIFVFVIWYSIKTRNKRIILLLLISSFYLFSVYKSGIVRADAHVIIIYQTAIFFSLLFLLLIIRTGKDDGNTYQLCLLHKKEDYLGINKKYLFYIVIIGLISCVIMSAGILCTKGYCQKTVPSIDSNRISLYITLSEQSKFEEYVLASFQQSGYNSFINYDKKYQNKTCDIYPWDVCMLMSSGYNYHPRPVIQSYSAYTSELDHLNEKHIYSNPSDVIFFDYDSIDNRYPMFDEPATFRAILENYQIDRYNSGYISLIKKEKLVSSLSSNNSTGIYHFYEEINIPLTDGMIIGRIEVKKNYLGIIKGILYKPSNMYISFVFEDGSHSDKYRVIPDLLQNGVILSPYVSNITEVSGLFNGSGKMVRSFIIMPDFSEEWNNTIPIEFSSINYLEK